MTTRGKRALQVGGAVTVGGILTAAASLGMGQRAVELLATDPKLLATKEEVKREIESERRVGAEVVKRIDMSLLDIQADIHEIARIQRDIFNTVAPRRAEASFPWDTQEIQP